MDLQQHIEQALKEAMRRKDADERNAVRALLTAIKEAVDNSLDACEEARILPDIAVEIRRGEPRVQQAASRIGDAEAAAALVAGSRLISRLRNSAARSKTLARLRSYGFRPSAGSASLRAPLTLSACSWAPRPRSARRAGATRAAPPP